MTRVTVVYTVEICEDGDAISVDGSELYDRDDWRALADDEDAPGLARAIADAACRYFDEEEALVEGLARSVQFVGVEVQGPNQYGEYRVNHGRPGGSVWGPWMPPVFYSDGMIQGRAFAAHAENVPAPVVTRK